MKKELIFIILTTLVLLIGCNSTTPEENINEEIPKIEEPPEMSIAVENEDIPKMTSSTKEFEIIAKKWEFSPSTINVNMGDEVILHITSLDVTHGISIPGFNIEENLEPGQSVDITFTADKTGEFEFSCSIVCGAGHGYMRGKIIVT